MTNVWADVAGPPSTAGGSTVTLVAGTTFCIADVGGDIRSGGFQGLFVLDTRVLSRLVLRVDGHPPEPLGPQESDATAHTFVSRLPPLPGRADSGVLVVRRREVGDGMAEEITLRNVGPEPVVASVCLHAEADFADLFAVKEARVLPGEPPHVSAEPGRLTFSAGDAEDCLRVSLSADGAHVIAHPADRDPGEPPPGDRRRPGSPQGQWADTVGGELLWDVPLAARGTWSVRVRVATGHGPGPLEDVALADPATMPPGSDHGRGVVGLPEWRREIPTVSSPDAALRQMVERSLADVGSLRILDPANPGRACIAAGAPWFMALFGRDALLSALMLLPAAPSLALGTLRTLADHQGTRVDPVTEEQPGRILHEVRFGRGARLSLGGRNVYYGSVDSTPLFVVLLGELARWGLPRTELEALLPHADAALEWIRVHGDRDGDGFVEYQRATDNGLLNQGWKDSGNSMTFATGELAEPPIALAEVQGYVHAAYVARAAIARQLGDVDGADAWSERAALLRAAFDERFWLADRGYFAMGLDAAKRPIDALASNMGHCLWSGIVEPARARAVADRLTSPEMFTGFGIRTLASTMRGYNPMGYHTGSVWPHDTAIAAAGLMRYGFVEEAHQVALALVAASEHFGGAMPELFCGFDAEDFPEPVPFPTACAPQAWAAASPLLLLRALLRLDPDVPAGRVVLAPEVPRSLLPLRVGGLHLAGARLSVEVTVHGHRVDGLPVDLEVVRG